MLRQNLIVFFLLTAIGFFAYRNCFSVFIPADNYGLLLLFKEKSFADAMNYEFHFSAPYFVGFPLHYILYRLFGTAPVYWVVSAISLHVLNAFLIYLLAEKILTILFSVPNKMIAFFSALCFLVSPYQTENVLWVSVIRWTFQSSAGLAGLYLFILYLSNPSFKKIVAIHFLFLLGIFSYESAMIFPLIFFIFFLLFKSSRKTSLSLKSFFIQLIFPQLLFIAGYFTACKIYTGYWLWHAGSMNSILQSAEYAKTLLKYFAKFFLFYRYLPIEDFDIQIKSISNYFVLPLIFFSLTALAFFFILFIKRKKEKGYFLLAMFLCFLISLLPVLPLDSSFLTYIYPDRYGYMSSVFFYLFLVSSFFFLLRKMALPVITGYVLICWVLLMKTIPAWVSTNSYCNHIIEKYRPFLEYENVYVLDAPAYYHGIAAFRSAFPEAIFFNYNSPQEKIRFISGSYHDSPADSLTSVTSTGNKINVKGNHRSAPYFSTVGGWAKSYQTDEYSVDFDSSGCSYLLSFKKEVPQNSAFIYPVNGEWKKVE